MNEAFAGVMQWSLSGAIVVGLTLVFRQAARGLPARARYALWLPALARFFTPGHLWSLSVPAMRAPEEGAAPRVLAETSELSSIEPGAATLEASVPSAGEVLWRIWLAGVLLVAVLALIQSVRVRLRLREAVRTEKGVYATDRFEIPFALGALRPRIYLPCGLDGEERELILRHEREHVRRRDPLTRILAQAALCLHWFNPLAWAAFIVSRNDMENACDESVISVCSETQRRTYARALLRFAERRAPGEASAFGRSAVKERIQRIMTYTKAKGGALTAIALAVVLLAAGCGTLAPREVAGLSAQSAGIEEIIPQEEDYAGLRSEYEAAGIETREDGLYYQDRLIRRLTDATAPGVIRFQHFNEIGAVDVDVIREETKLADGSTELGGRILRLETREPPGASAGGVVRDGWDEARAGQFEESGSGAAASSGGAVSQVEEGYETATKPGATEYYAADEITSESIRRAEGAGSEGAFSEDRALRLLEKLKPYGVTYREADGALEIFWNGERLSGLVEEGPAETTFYGCGEDGDAPLGVIVRDASGRVVALGCAPDFDAWKQMTARE